MDNISKCVISLQEKKEIGYVLKPYIDFDAKARLGYIIVDSDSEQEYFVRNEFIKKISDCMLIESSTILEPVNFQDELRKKVVSDSGEDFGRIRDFVFEGEKLKKIVADKGEINARFVESSGEDVVVISFKKKKKMFPRFKDENVKVEVQEEKVVELPEKISLALSNFFGKVAVKTLLGMNNEIIIKEGQKINKQVYEKAKRHNKLNQLFFISKIENK